MFLVENHRMVTDMRKKEMYLYSGTNTDGNLYIVDGNIEDTPTKGGWHYFSVIYLHAIFMFLGWRVSLQVGM